MSRYQSDKEVPRAHRRLEGATLSLVQIEEIVKEAEASAQPFPIALFDAKEAFKQSHHIVAGFWIPKGE